MWKLGCDKNQRPPQALPFILLIGTRGWFQKHPASSHTLGVKHRLCVRLLCGELVPSLHFLLVRMGVCSWLPQKARRLLHYVCITSV